MQPAGFWRRAVAWSLDAGLVALPLLALQLEHLRRAAGALSVAGVALLDACALRMADALHDAQSLPALVAAALHDPVLRAAAGGVQAAASALLLPPLVAFVATFMAWSIGFERSRWRATPGKRALGMRVVAPAQGRPGTVRLLVRFMAGGLCWLTLNIGHLLAAVPPRHAALHDRVSGTRVCVADGAPARMPGWARAWLWLVAAAVVAATALAMSASGRALRAALERALG